MDTDEKDDLILGCLHLADELEKFAGDVEATLIERPYGRGLDDGYRLAAKWMREMLDGS